MLKKIVLGVTLVGLAVALAPAASAACNPPKDASTYNSATGAYVFWAANDSGGAGLVGQTWQLGSYGTWNDRAQGSSPACGSNMLYNVGSNVGLQLGLGGCGTGCPAPGATLAVLAMSKGASDTDFELGTSGVNALPGPNYDFSVLGSQTMIKIPRPTVNSSSRAANLVNLQLSVAATTGGTFGSGAQAITGYRVLAVQSNTDPGRDAAAYPVTVATLTTSGAGPAGPIAGSVDCTNGTVSYQLVTQLILEGGAVGSDAVSGATRVSCGPGNLADPKFKIVDKHPASKNTPKR